MESKYTTEELDRFNQTFSDTWIESLNWSASAKQAFAEGMQVINSFREKFVVQLSILILSGDHLLNETKSLDELLTLVNNMIEDVIPRKTLKVKLTLEYQSMLKDMIDVIRLVKNHIRQTRKSFNQTMLLFQGTLYHLRKIGTG